MARHQRHLRQFGHVPCADHQATRIGIALDLVDQPLHLVDRLAVGAFPTAPLLAVYGAQFAVLVGPLVPDADLVVLQIRDVGLALQEPQQLVDDRAQVQLLGGDQREAFVQVEAHLPAEHAARARAGAVGLLGTVLQHVAQQVEVLLHARSPAMDFTVYLPATGAGTRGWSVGARRDSHSRYRPSSTSGTLRIWPLVNQPHAT